MSIEVFKTNVVKEQEADQLLLALVQRFPGFEMNFDLEDCDHILRIEGHAVSNDHVIELLSKYGYQCSALA